MSETPGVYNVGIPRPQKTSFEFQLQALPPDVRSVAESLALRDLESAKRYMAQYLAANRGVRSDQRTITGTALANHRT
jgi:hypothetical protein